MYNDNSGDCMEKILDFQKEVVIKFARGEKLNDHEMDIVKNFVTEFNASAEASIQDEKETKKQEIHGELYKGKEVYKELIKKVATFITLTTMAVGLVKIGKDDLLVRDYKMILKDVASKELDGYELNKFMEENSDIKPSQIRSMETSLDSGQYTVLGNRIDGTHSEYQYFEDKDGIFAANDKEFDAMEELAKGRLESYTKGK